MKERKTKKVRDKFKTEISELTARLIENVRRTQERTPETLAERNINTQLQSDLEKDM